MDRQPRDADRARLRDPAHHRPDEGLDNVHNNSYTNMAAIVVLREAIACARRLGFAPPAQWVAIERGMFLPMIRGRRSC